MDKSLYSDFETSESNNNWWFKARKNIILNIIKNKFKNNKNISILDIGSGTGYILESLKVDGYENLLGVDFSDDAITIAKSKGLNVIKGSLPSELNLDKQFDVVLSLDVIEHINEDVESLLKIKENLKEDSIFIITVPAFMFLWGYHDEINHHKRRYKISELSAKLNSTGYKIEFLSYYNFFLFPFAILYKFLNKNESKIDNNNSGFINKIFYYIFNFESKFINNKIKFPFGVSIIGILTKK